MTTIASAMLQVIGKGFKDMFLRFMGHPPEIPSPFPRKKREDVSFNRYTVSLIVENLPTNCYVVSVQDTNSMDGLIDIKHLLVMTEDFGIEELTVGDPIMYRHNGKTILHQIVFIGEDKKGLFFLTKGTNHFWVDLLVVRSGDIISRLIAIIYG